MRKKCIRMLYEHKMCLLKKVVDKNLHLIGNIDMLELMVMLLEKKQLKNI